MKKAEILEEGDEEREREEKKRWCRSEAERVALNMYDLVDKSKNK